MKFIVLVTRVCNLKCSYCYCSKEDNTNMTLDTAKKVVEYLKKFDKDSISINFLGGEPLINFEIIKYIANEIKLVFNNTNFFVTTNGTICNQEIFDFLLKDNSFEVTISVDGDKDAHDKYRLYKNGNPTYLDVLKNLKIISDNYGSTIRIRGTVTPENVDNLFNNCKILYDNYSKLTVFLPDYFNTGWDKKSIKTYGEEYLKLFSYMKENEYDFFNDVFSSFVESNFKKVPPCDMGSSNLKIDYDGSIYPCHFGIGNSEFKIGDVVNGLNRSVLNGFKTINESDNDECVNCKRYNNCVTKRCKIINKLCTGDYLTPSSTMCHILNEHYNLIINIMNNIGDIHV